MCVWVVQRWPTASSLLAAAAEAVQMVVLLHTWVATVEQAEVATVATALTHPAVVAVSAVHSALEVQQGLAVPASWGWLGQIQGQVVTAKAVAARQFQLAAVAAADLLQAAEAAVVLLEPLVVSLTIKAAEAEALAAAVTWAASYLALPVMVSGSAMAKLPLLISPT
jgi:hypothetical protein